MNRSKNTFSLFALSLLVVMAVFGVAFASNLTLAQDSSGDMMMSPWEQACPEDAATGLRDALMIRLLDDNTGADATEDAMMDMTEEPMMEMTEDGMGMDMTEEPMMEMTEDGMGMDMTAEATMDGMMMDRVSCLYGEFSGVAEVPGPGDEDGTGIGLLTLDFAAGTVCFDVAVANITLPADAMHIHIGEPGEAGDVVVPAPGAPDANGVFQGCTEGVDTALMEDIANNPGGYYLNVHTSDFPAGAVRAQLEDYEGEVDDMSQMMDTDDMEDMEGMDATAEATPGG
ncbi:MAG: CHRD domain-containing protein [bacterium]|nr:CHRD domain-containing protein [bacterium]